MCGRAGRVVEAMRLALFVLLAFALLPFAAPLLATPLLPAGRALALANANAPLNEEEDEVGHATPGVGSHVLAPPSSPSRRVAVPQLPTGTVLTPRLVALRPRSTPPVPSLEATGGTRLRN